MDNYRKLNHTTWDCKYHLVWIPKYRKKIIYGHLRKYLGETLRELALHKESHILEGHLMGDHVHMLVSIPPNIQYLNLSGISKEKALFISPGLMQADAKILQAKVFGPEDILSRR